MFKITLPAALLRAASHFQAKDDIRYYLNGILIDPAGYIVATNGHIMIRCECEEAKQISKQTIVQIKGKIPAKAHEAHLLFYAEEEGVISYSAKGYKQPKAVVDARHFFKVIDGKYPDVDRVIPKTDLEPVDKISFNGAYAGLVGKAAAELKYKSSDIHCQQITPQFRGQNTAICFDVSSADHPNCLAIVMPARI